MSYSSDDIIQGALDKAGELPNNRSKYYNLAIKKLNSCYLAFLSGANEFDIDLGEPWPWALNDNPAVIVLKAPYSQGNAYLTNGSATGAFDTPPSFSVAGRWIKFKERPDFFKILTHSASGTSFTIDCPYTEETGFVAFDAHCLEYSLNNVLRLANSFSVCKNQNTYSENRGKIYGIDFRVFREEFPISKLLIGTPDKFAELRQVESSASTKILTLIFNSSVEEDTRAEIDYIPYPQEFSSSSTGFPIIPERFREVLEHAIAYYVLLEKKDDQTADYLAITKAKLKALVQDRTKTVELVSRERGRLQPRQDQLRRITRGF